MANSFRFCMRFINYAAVLILLIFSSSSFANYPGGGGGFGGAGAGGSWDDDTCPPQYSWRTNAAPGTDRSTADASCAVWAQPIAPFWNTYSYNSVQISDTSYQCSRTWVNTSQNRTTTGNATAIRITSPNYDPNCDQCPDGYQKDANGKCQPKKCPVGQTLINGQCKPKQCPAGQALDSNGNCKPRDDVCSDGQELVNGQCRPKDRCPPGYSYNNIGLGAGTCTKDNDDDNPPSFELPPFCEWASVMCQWYQDWKDWSNDYNANEQKASLDREEIKQNQQDIQEILQNTRLTLDDIKNQDMYFYDEVRLWLQNFDHDSGTPSEQNPSIEFPAFCDWSVQVCNWYLDWKDWRTDYNANNDAIKEKLDAHLAKLEQIKQQDETHHNESSSFFDDVRDFFSWYKNQADEDDPADPDSPTNADGNVEVYEQQITVDESSRITFDKTCPAGEHINVNIMGTNTSFEFSYQPLCTFMSMIRPFVIAIAYLIGAYILMGLSRGNSD